ncbi:DUF3275 family protein [Pseudomonas chlororaphis]|uniref:DUF3275 family protein n=1 Tax=Pseudomonas chlororaphis subsp. aureofaciens TaxID=587851 RepID=A0AAD0ZRZ3_9PSED|nr:DUF3275 family protein [Pseudomonas chlororaphis]AZC91305.1 hypothetical protein C4K29_5026 [Pseudomonas chlororaphis subsp. piscium]AZE31591.1 hypothetical protein C4K07_4828 [Pseudomonas chlororaphis subsp. aureofaciens]
MINLPGQLTIRTINGRNGDFNVGRLSTSIGEFVIKDALLDQYNEGKYRGDFVITEIRPSYYTTGGRLVVEIRAKLDSMTLDDVANLSAEEADRLSSTELDPIDEEPSSTSTPDTARKPHRHKSSPSTQPDDDAPFGMETSPTPAPITPQDADKQLFGTIWPIGPSVRLDTTVDRQRLRQQCARLGELGYELDFKLQLWTLSSLKQPA